MIPPALPTSAPIQELIEQLEDALLKNQLHAQELARILEVKDISSLPLSLRMRYQAALGFYYNLQVQLPLAEKCFLRALELLDHDYTLRNRRSYLLAQLAGVYINQGRLQDAEKSLDEAVKALSQNAHPSDLAIILCRRAFIMLHYTRFDQATSLFLESLRSLSSDLPTEPLEAFIANLVWSGLGEVRMHMGDKAKCKEAYLRCLKICEVSGIQARIGWHYLNAGTCFMNEGDQPQARIYFQKALNAADHKNVHVNANTNMGISHLRDQQYQLALQYFDAADAVRSQPVLPEDFSNRSVSQLHRSEIHFALGELDQCIKHLEMAFVDGCKGDNRLHLINVCNRLAQVHAQRNEYRQAYEYQRHSEIYLIEHHKRLNEEKIRELEIKHASIEKEKEALLAKSELSALQLRSLRAQFNPHFMFNALNSLANLIAANRNDEASDALVEFSKLLRMSLDLSNEEWIPLHKEIEFAMLYIQLQKRLKFRGNLHAEVILPQDIALAQPKIPSMVLQPFIENSVEHGLSPNDGGTIKLTFAYDAQNLLSCIIEDDGIGLNASRKIQAGNLQGHKSRGMQFTLDRLKMLHELIGSKKEPLMLQDLSDVENRSGTRVTLLFPVH